MAGIRCVDVDEVCGARSGDRFGVGSCGGDVIFVGRFAGVGDVDFDEAAVVRGFRGFGGGGTGVAGVGSIDVYVCSVL